MRARIGRGARAAPRGAPAGKREKNRTGPACVLGFCSGPGAGGAILVIRRDQTADAVCGRAGWWLTGRAAKGWLECGCHICANYRRALRRAREGNDEISGATVRRRRQGRVGAAAAVAGNFSNPSDPLAV